jgi:hypothetical protein
VIKKLTIYTLLLSMALHCICRLGVLDMLYQQRHQIAYAIRFIEEMPISVCSHYYSSDKGLILETRQSESTLPSGFFQAQEIKLFFSTTALSINSDYQLLTRPTWGDFFIRKYTSPFAAIFHPPSLIS